MKQLDCHLIELPIVRDTRGALSFAQTGDHVPFGIKRVFFLYDVQPRTARGGHAHIDCHQGLIALSGQVEALVTTRSRLQHRYVLDRPNELLHVPPHRWIDLISFSPGAILLVLASHIYDEADYVRDWALFVGSDATGQAPDQEKCNE